MPPAPGPYARLLSPLDVGPITLRNRLVMGSMHVGLEDRIEDVGALTEYIGERARGGVGLIVTGGYSPNRSGRLTPRGARMTPAISRAHTVLTREVHEHDGRIILQLLHAGRYAFHPLAASASAGRSPISPFPARRMTRPGIRRTIADYARAAHLAIRAGYDGVEIMGSEGYLLNQFLAPRTNHRRDRYGGEAAARRLLPLEVTAAVREAIGPEHLLSYRISLDDLVEQGQDRAETLALAQALVGCGVDVLSTGIGWHESRVPTIVSSVPAGAFTEATQALREQVEVPVIASNRVHDPDLAEQVIRSGQADLVSMARPLLADPQLPAKLARDQARQVVACISCNQACLDRVFSGERAGCLVNPRAGHETELVLLPTRHARRVAVVGAGPAGLEAAITAAERGHTVTLFEAGDQLGGQFRYAARIPGKETYADALESWRARLVAAGVGVRVNTRPTPEELQVFDDVVVATGVRPRALDLPGAVPDPPGTVPDGTRVLDYAQLLSLPRPRALAAVGETVAIIGAGGIGVDVAEFLTAPEPSLTLDTDRWRRRWALTDAGQSDADGSDPDPAAAPAPPGPREVHLLQRKPGKIGAHLGRTTGWVHRAELRHAGVIEHRGVSYERIDERGLHLVQDGEPRLLEVDTVVICAGQESERTLAAELSQRARGAGSDTTHDDAHGPSTPRVHVIGGADVAAELDAERAIGQAVHVASVL